MYTAICFFPNKYLLQCVDIYIKLLCSCLIVATMILGSPESLEQTDSHILLFIHTIPILFFFFSDDPTLVYVNYCSLVFKFLYSCLFYLYILLRQNLLLRPTIYSIIWNLKIIARLCDCLCYCYNLCITDMYVGVCVCVWVVCELWLRLLNLPDWISHTLILTLFLTQL